jgi:hypothetical protein
LGIPKTSAESNTFSPASEFNRVLSAVVGKEFHIAHYGGYLADLYTDRKFKGKTRGDAEEFIRGKLQSLFLYYPEQLKQILEETKRQYQQAGEPEMFVEFKRLAAETYPKLMEQIEGSGTSLQGLDRAADTLTGSFARLSGAVPAYFPLRDFSNPSVGNPFQPKRKDPFNVDHTVFGGPSRASGGTVERDGWAYVHASEDIIPARVTRAYSPRSNPALSGRQGAHSGDINLHFHIAKDSPAAQSPRALATAVAHEVRRQRERR